MKPTFNVREQSEIYIGPTADILSGVLPEGRVIVVSDATIDRLYHPLLAPYDTVLIGAGESIKTLQTVESIYRRFIELGADRSTFVLAVGGGIVTDVAGFAAATYMRGLSFGFVSTTLLGQVDASVGGDFGRIMAWADKYRRLQVRTNADTPHDAAKARELGAQGIGLCRTEHMFFEGDRIAAIREMICSDTVEQREKALAKLLPMQQGDFEGIYEAMEGCPVTIRFLDPPLHEFVPTEEADIEKLAKAQGKTVVLTTQVQNEGSDLGIYQVGHSLKADLGVMETYDMTLEMAVAKLMWALAQTKDPAEVTRYFYTPVANDILRVPGESL